MVCKLFSAMPHSKVKCPKCKKLLDQRGLKSHMLTHGIRKEKSKEGPYKGSVQDFSNPPNDYRQGYRDGYQDGLKDGKGGA